MACSRAHAKLFSSGSWWSQQAVEEWWGYLRLRCDRQHFPCCRDAQCLRARQQRRSAAHVVGHHMRYGLVGIILVDAAIVMMVGLFAPMQKRMSQISIPLRCHRGVRRSERLPDQAGEQCDEDETASHGQMLAAP